MNDKAGEQVGINEIIDTYLTPYVKRIDREALYPKHYIQMLGKEGYFLSNDKTEVEVILQRVAVIEKTAKVCMTTAFCLWCHFAAIVYITNTKNHQLRKKILPKLESGELLAGTGLSNPLKTFSSIEKIHLTARKVENGYIINGSLPAISNIGKGHAFAFIARSETSYIMGFISCDDERLSLNERTNYLGMNGSATYSCTFTNVFIPESDIISYEAIKFVQSVRSLFVSYQIPLGLGVTASSIASIEKMYEKNASVNKYLQKGSEDIKARYVILRKCLRKQIRAKCYHWKDIVNLRLDTAYLTLDAVQAAMIHSGGAGYLKESSVSRKLREAYFLVNLTPTVKHLEKIKQENAYV